MNVEQAPAAEMEADHAAAPLQELDPRVIRLWRISLFLRGGLFTLLAVASEWVLPLPLPTGLLPFVLAVVTVFVAVIVPPMRYRAWRYALRTSDLFLRHGVVFRTTSIVPHARIQHVDTNHGPIDRWVGLAAVVVYTAGTRGAIITIPGLDRPEAEALRDRLAELSGAGDAV